MLDRSGQSIDNRYRFICLLAKGGQGDVYLAQDISSPKNDLVAVKVLHTEIDIESFINEARATIALLPDCPHVLRIKDFGVDNGTPFLVTDYMPNGSLRQRYPKGQRVALESIISYVKQVSEALQCLHDRGRVHRDVNPDNMMIDMNNQLLLSDFGIAIPSYSKNHNILQRAAGKLEYIAPEQIEERASSASDQYSLGITVYEWLTGHPPFPFQGNKQEVLSQHLYAHPRPLREKIPTLSREVEEVVLTTLNKKPQQRFKTVTDFAMALEQANRFAPALLTYRAHIDGVHTLSWSPDGKYIASAGSDEKICIWETVRSKTYLTYDHSHTGDIWTVA